MSERTDSLEQSMGMPSLASPAPEWAPEVDARLARVGMWMWLGANVLFFAGWFFAFFYLRALNNNNDWTPPGVTHPTQAIGAAIPVLAAVSAWFYWVGVQSAAKKPTANRALLWLALAAGILAVGVQVYEFGHLGFSPQDGGGYPSVFVGMKGAWLVELVGALLWLAGNIAQARPGGDVNRRPGSAAAFGYFLAFLTGIGIISYIVLYFV